MVELLEDLVGNDTGEASRLSICLASRHYPTIIIQHSRRLVLEGETGHADDLRKYIHRRLQAGKSKKLDDIRTQVQEKANGVFMWVVLVVEILNKEFQNGRIFAVERRLRDIPTELSELFKDLLQRDDENLNGLLLCLQWILFAKRPLTREEFYYAMEADLHDPPEDTGQWRPHPWDPEDVTAENMNNYVLSSSKGLAELTRSKKAPVVQFIHESVRDFLLEDGGMRELWPEFGEDVASISHTKLWKCCTSYSAADLSNLVDVSEPLPKAKSDETKSLRQRVSSQFPFIQYAFDGLLYHADKAATDASEQNVLEGFPQETFVYLNNLYETYENRRYSHDVSLLYILAEQNHHRLIKTLQLEDIWIRVPREKYQFPVFAAFANGHRESLQVLLGANDSAIMDELVKDPGFGKGSECGRTEGPLAWATSNLNFALSRFLLAADSCGTISSVPEQDRMCRSLLVAPAKLGAQAMMQYILDAGADVNATYVGKTALQAASEACQEGAVKLLLDAGANVNTVAGGLGSALYWASFNGQEKTVQMLLNAGAGVDNHQGLLGQGLYGASCGGSEKTVQLLLAAGAEVDAQGGFSGTALQAASLHGFEKIAQLLLAAGANVDAQGGHFGNALQAASERGHEKMVELLLVAGADMNARGWANNTALEATSGRGHEEVVRILISAGADLEEQGTAALNAARMKGHENVVRLLLDAGVE